MVPNTRREFLADVGRGMLVASLGSAVAADLGLAPAFAADGADALDFGKLEPLVALLQETPTDKLMPVLVEKLKDGTDLRTLVAAGALANARTFGGQHYEGYHTFMALAPAFEMAKELPEAQRPLPVLKVLYRNATHIQAKGGRKNEVLHPVKPTPVPEGKVGRRGAAGTDPQERPGQRPRASSPTLAQGTPDDAFNHVLYCVEDDIERPPRRAGVAGLGDARLHRQGARPHAAAPVGPVLLQREPRRPADRDPDAAAEAARPVQAGREEARHPGGRRRLGRGAGQGGLRRRAGEGGRRGRRGPGRGVLAGGRSARRSPWPRTNSCCTTPAAPRRTGPSRRGASTATRSGCTPPTRPTPGGTSPGSATPATRSPA